MADLRDEVTRGVPAHPLRADTLRTAGGPVPSEAEGTPVLRNPSAAYEVDDFQLVALGEVGFGPLAPRDNIAI